MTLFSVFIYPESYFGELFWFLILFSSLTKKWLVVIWPTGVQGGPGPEESPGGAEAALPQAGVPHRPRHDQGGATIQVYTVFRYKK